MTDDELPERWYREVQGPDGHWYVIKAVRRGQDLRWMNDAWLEEFVWVVGALLALVRHPFRRTRQKRELAAGGFVVGVIHDGHFEVRIIRSVEVDDEPAVEAALDQYETDVRSGAIRR